MSEATIVEKVVAMGYQSNAHDFHNSVYTTLYTLQRKGLVKKSSAGERMWILTDRGTKQADENVAEQSSE